MSTAAVGLVASRIAQSRKRVRHSEQGHRQICPHCDQSLCSKTFKKHRRLYRKEDGSWVVMSGFDKGESKFVVLAGHFKYTI